MLPRAQVFNPLRKGSVRAIATKLLNESAERAASALQLSVTYSAALTARVCAAGMDIDTGARKLRRAVTSIVDDPLSEYALREGDVSGRVVLVDTTPDDVTFVSEVQAEREAAREEERHVMAGPGSAGQGMVVPPELAWALQIEEARVMPRVKSRVRADA